MEKSITNMNSIVRFYDWMNDTGKAKIVKFAIDADTAFDFMDQTDTEWKWHNAHYESYTTIIDSFLKIDNNTLEDYIAGKLSRDENSYKCYAESDTIGYDLYKVIKMYWLYESIKNDCQHAPIQMHRNKEGYRFHPGSDKINSLYLLSKILGTSINVFYIWYSDIDEDFPERVKDYETVNTPQEFADMFVKFNHQSFKIIEDDFTVNKKVFKSNAKHFDVFGEYFMDTLETIQKDESMELRHISYNDNIHHKGIDLEIDLVKSFYVSKENGLEIFNFPNELKFIKRHVDIEDFWDYHWTPECDGTEKF